MASFLTEIDERFNILLKKKSIIKTDLLELKTFIINIYETDTSININELKNFQRKIYLDSDSECESDD